MEKGLTGKFITFEGAEGSGKSTQAALACRYLEEKKARVLHIREPGGVKISEAIRRILLNVKNTGMSDACEMLLYMAARSQLIEEVILPELRKGTTVLCDRYLDSTLAYQGYGNGVDLKIIKEIGTFATRDLTPDLTLLFDIDTQKGFSRMGREKDRIEMRALGYHTRVRKGYLQMAQKEPQRFRVIQGDKSKEEIFQTVKTCLDQLLGF